MRSIQLMLALVCMFVVSSAHAKSAENFFKRFQVIRTPEGKLVGIRDRFMPTKFSVLPYVSMVKEQLRNEQSLLSSNLSSGAYEAEVVSLLNEDREEMIANGMTPTQFDANVDRVVTSLKKLTELNVEGIFANPAFNEVVSKYEGKMTDAILMLDPSILAQVNDPSFFYKRNVTYQVVDWGLNFARKRLSHIPLLNTASYVIVQVEKLITERRQFHQNMLLHYLENFDSKELGLTHDEVNMIWSSIYESRIPWFAFWESSAAKGNWMKYGVDNFYYNYRAATTKLRNAGSIYTEISDRMNYGFQKVTYNNERVVVNLFDNESMFQKRPAVAFNYDRPTSIARKRVMLTLAKLGLSFVPMSAMIKDTAGSFIKSFYEQQRITEGALYGYFESMGDSHGMTQVKKQYLNPFDMLAI